MDNIKVELDWCQFEVSKHSGWGGETVDSDTRYSICLESLITRDVHYADINMLQEIIDTLKALEENDFETEEYNTYLKLKSKYGNLPNNITIKENK